MNLILTCARNLEHDAKNEIKQIFEELGDEDSKITITSMSGILTCITKLDPLLVIEKIKEKIPFDKKEYETMNFSNIRQLNQAMIDLIEDDESTDPNITGLPISDDE